MREVPQYVVDYLEGIETLVSPARHLPADRPGVITGGFGETDKTRVHEGMIVPRELAKVWMVSDLAAIGASVEHTFSGITLTDGQYGALCSFSYNEGIHCLASPTCSISRYLREGNTQAAADAFLLYDVANKQHLKGLLTRRMIERGWFLSI